ncbi:hypothetical protein TNCV_2418721 [Trichonephila clavipes]|nr:hypothetical protein TNCV_2418721 [Trichonephila clavipes]
MLPTARRKLYGHSLPCGAGVDHHALTSPSVVHYQFSSSSVLVGPLLPNSHHCGTVPLPTSSYCAIGKSSFLKADSPPPFKLQRLERNVSTVCMTFGSSGTRKALRPENWFNLDCGSSYGTGHHLQRRPQYSPHGWGT